MILIVEDDLAMRESLEAAVELAGYDFVSARDGDRALTAVEAADPDLILLDIMMPNLDGLSVVRRLRSKHVDTPILVLTARDTVRDRVEGLDAGADDYLPKPFDLDELLARIRALLRRGRPSGDDDLIRVADLVVYPGERLATRAGRGLELTKVEFDTLLCLARNVGIVLSRATLLDQVWGDAVDPTSKTLEVHISYLRNKTEGVGEPRLIQTVRGVGYVLREP